MKRTPQPGLIFTPGNHTYRLDGQPVPGVTTILGCLDKPAIPKWAAKVVAEYVAGHPDVIETLRNAGGNALVNTLKDVPWQKRDTAGARGTDLHDILERLADALDSDAWYTPAWVFDGLGIEFDLDVAAPADPLPWLPARSRYTVADDGLLQPWYGTVWCNPPYSAPTAWCKKWAAHSSGCLLIRADLSTSGPFAAWSAASSVYVPAKRLQFVNGHGGATGAVNFSTVLLGRGPVADAGLVRLAQLYGGAAHLFSQSVATSPLVAATPDLGAAAPARPAPKVGRARNNNPEPQP